MRLRSTIMLSATTIALLASGQVIGQTGAPPKQAVDPKNRPEDLQGRSRRVTKLLDCTVKNAKDEKIGSIKDVVIDKDEGCVAYAVLSFGGFLSVGEKLFLIPLASINRTDDEEVVILNVAKEQLEKAPNFAADTWPTIDAKYGTLVHEYYKATP